jgi:hypothetical protein
MAQIAIPLLLLGTAVLISNDKNEDNEEERKGFKENMTNLNEIDSRGDLLSKEYSKYHPNIDKSIHNMNNQQNVSQHQDKYYLNNISGEEQKSSNRNGHDTNVFNNLAGEKIKYDDINHNNMNLYYGSKTNGVGDMNTSSILDSYTGEGTYDIKKEEIATMFKPEDNTQNVYGNQNQTDFFQSRVNASLRHANDKPWEEIKVAPGLGKKYDETVTTSGFNNYNEARDMWMPKGVDELRTSNNPKNVYCLHDHMGPAVKTVQNRGQQGKIVKKTADSYFVNKDNLGMIAGTSGPKMHTAGSHQMLTNENRDNTSVEYYGTRSNKNSTSYSKQNYSDPNKQQLEGVPITNRVDTATNPTSEQNYGKQSYNSHNNNRNTTKSSHYGGMGSAVSSIIQPIINGLRHSKKVNTTTSLQSSGNIGLNNVAAHTIRNKQEVSTTNREMYECDLNMNHLNVQKQQDSAYMNINPVLNATQRNSMNQGEVGHAASQLSGNMSYVAQYNQENNNRIYASDVQSNGNIGLFNNKIVSQVKAKECENNRSTPLYMPKSSSYQHPIDTLGTVTSIPQNYQEISNSQLDSSLLDAFKSNPYTQSLNSS